jgi:nucleotide-binding universal stress UspA family protein
MKILIGVDESPHSKAAVNFVRRMTWPKDTRVTVVSVAPSVVAAYAEVYMPAALPVAAADDLVRMHEDIVSNAEQALRGTSLTTQARVLQGDPRTTLVEVAESEGADLVVVGSHGRTGIAKLFMGSVASHVVAHAPCSVLVVKLEKP